MAPLSDWPFPPVATGGPSGRRVQYAALPYRVRRDGEVQIRLITSRETRRWVVPKGWPIKGLTPPKTAAREAYEEAGLIGVVSREPMGSYTYEKRLGSRSVLCDVLLFPLKVKRLLQKWPERFQRYGFWFSVETAAAAVQEEDLAALILAFGAVMARRWEEKQRSTAPKAGPVRSDRKKPVGGPPARAASAGSIDIASGSAQPAEAGPRDVEPPSMRPKPIRSKSGKSKPVSRDAPDEGEAATMPEPVSAPVAAQADRSDAATPTDAVPGATTSASDGPGAGKTGKRSIGKIKSKADKAKPAKSKLDKAASDMPKASDGTPVRSDEPTAVVPPNDVVTSGLAGETGAASKSAKNGGKKVSDKKLSGKKVLGKKNLAKKASAKKMAGDIGPAKSSASQSSAMTSSEGEPSENESSADTLAEGRSPRGKSAATRSGGAEAGAKTAPAQGRRARSPGPDTTAT